MRYIFNTKYPIHQSIKHIVTEKCPYCRCYFSVYKDKILCKNCDLTIDADSGVFDRIIFFIQNKRYILDFKDDINVAELFIDNIPCAEVELHSFESLHKTMDKLNMIATFK